MALAFDTVANSIAALSVTGLTIKDIDEIPPKVDIRAPTLIPLPDYVTDFDVDLDSFGGGSTAKMTVTYTLGYRMCYKPAGSGRDDLEYYDDMIKLVADFLDAVLAIETLTGAIDIMPLEVVNMGLVNDPADNSYVGCDIRLMVQEFVN